MNIATPRLYIDLLQYNMINGLPNTITTGGDLQETYGRIDGSSLIGMTPYNTHYFIPNDSDSFINIRYAKPFNNFIDTSQGANKLWVGLFGHNFRELDNGNSQTRFKVKMGEYSPDLTSIINCDINTANNETTISFPQNGFSMFTINSFNGGEGKKTIKLLFDNNWDYEDTSKPAILGTIGSGIIYDFNHAPDMQLSMTRDFSGSNKVETVGGHQHVNLNWYKVADWGKTSPYELQGYNTDILSDTDTEADAVRQGNARTGRRIFDMRYSFLDRDKAFPRYELQQSLDDGLNSTLYDFDDGNDVSVGIDEDTDTKTLYGDVLRYTVGDACNFLFQYNKDNFKGDELAICKFNQSKFQFQQVLHNKYTVNLSMTEQI